MLKWLRERGRSNVIRVRRKELTSTIRPGDSLTIRHTINLTQSDGLDFVMETSSLFVNKDGVLESQGNPWVSRMELLKPPDKIVQK